MIMIKKNDLNGGSTGSKEEFD